MYIHGLVRSPPLCPPLPPPERSEALLRAYQAVQLTRDSLGTRHLTKCLVRPYLCSWHYFKYSTPMQVFTQLITWFIHVFPQGFSFLSVWPFWPTYFFALLEPLAGSGATPPARLGAEETSATHFSTHLWTSARSGLQAHGLAQYAYIFLCVFNTYFLSLKAKV